MPGENETEESKKRRVVEEIYSAVDEIMHYSERISGVKMHYSEKNQKEKKSNKREISGWSRQAVDCSRGRMLLLVRGRTRG